MAIFMDTGGGDIYAAETKEECLAAMREDIGEKEFQILVGEASMRELPGSTKMRVENEDGTIGPLSTLAEEYTNLGHGYLIASENY